MALTKADPLIQQRFAIFNRYFRAPELFARATGELARIPHRHTVVHVNNIYFKFSIAGNILRFNLVIHNPDSDFRSRFFQMLRDSIFRLEPVIPARGADSDARSPACRA